MRHLLPRVWFGLLFAALLATSSPTSVSAGADRPVEGGPGVEGGPEADPQPGAKQMVFVCHLTGDNTLPVVRKELKNATGGLRPTQSFDIVLLSETGRPVHFSKNGLAPASEENKRKVETFLEAFKATKSDNPLAALSAAFRKKPELVYLLTDAKSLNKNVTADQIAKLNTGKIKVNTILFENHSKEMEELLQAVAERNGGNYRYVKTDDLE